MKKTTFLILLIILASCGTSSKKRPCPQTIESTSVEKLSKIIDLSKFRPVKTKFMYVFCDNSGKDDRSIPGPSDFYLEALMYFDPETFNRMQMVFMVNSELRPIPDFKKEEFDFAWLKEEIKTELAASDSSYHGEWDKAFGTNGRVWQLENKLLLYCGTNMIQ